MKVTSRSGLSLGPKRNLTSLWAQRNCDRHLFPDSGRINGPNNPSLYALSRLKGSKSAAGFYSVRSKLGKTFSLACQIIIRF